MLDGETSGFPGKSGRRFGRFLGQPGPMHDGARHAEGARRVADGPVSGLLKVGRCHISGEAAQPLPRRANPGEASPNSLRDSGSLKFGQGREDVELQSPSRGRAVDALAQRHERDAEGLHVLQQCTSFFSVAARGNPARQTNQDVEPPRRFASCISASRAGRLSFVPDTPLSTNSVGVHPRARRSAAARSAGCRRSVRRC